jgi:hypothetical protein
MGFLVFLAVAVAVVGGPLVWMAWRSRQLRGMTNMVVIWHASSEADKAITIGALRSAGIRPHVVDSGPAHSPEIGNIGPFIGYRYEIWVPARDETRAREVLGL